MKIDVVLHSLPGDKRAGELARVVHQLYHDRRRVIVWVADDGRRQILDDFLWTFNKLAFVPHRMWGSSLGPADDPVLLVGEEANPNQADVLVIGDDCPPAEWARGFAEIHDFIAASDEGVERNEWWCRWRDEGIEGEG